MSAKHVAGDGTFTPRQRRCQSTPHLTDSLDGLEPGTRQFLPVFRETPDHIVENVWYNVCVLRGFHAYSRRTFLPGQGTIRDGFGNVLTDETALTD